MKRDNNNKKKLICFCLAFLVVLCVAIIYTNNSTPTTSHNDSSQTTVSVEYTAPTTNVSADFTLPEYTGTAYAVINNNQPQFDDLNNRKAFEKYSHFDSLGRCGVAYANICQQLMPTEKRGDISSVKPSGWSYNKKSNNNSYSASIVDGGRIYNRCHLIGFQLAGENDNKENLVTGTRYMNVDGMLPFENMVADYVKEMGGHVLYRVTPIYVNDELVCRGVQIEAYSVEDHGESICFNVFCFNVQPGIEINYATGENWLSDNKNTATSTKQNASAKYVINENTKKFHKPNCKSAQKITSDNKLVLVENRNDLLKQGYSPCKSCNP